MRQLFVDFDKEPNNYAECVAELDHAYETGESVPVSGAHEGVEVGFSLFVESVTKRRRAGKQILEFSGVTEPEALPYHADYDDSLSKQKIDLQIYTDIDSKNSQI